MAACVSASLGPWQGRGVTGDTAKRELQCFVKSELALPLGLPGAQHELFLRGSCCLSGCRRRGFSSAGDRLGEPQGLLALGGSGTES